MNTDTIATQTFSVHDPSEQTDETQSALHALEQQMSAPDLPARTLGSLGEQYAALWLSQRGWQVVARNWGSRFGELDIIMLQDDGTLVFVEVKTRRTLRYGTPQEAITRSKQINLRRAALLWLHGPGRHIQHSGIRFDAIALWLHNGHVLTHLIPGAF